ncbi:MarR family winged helix-turn-helix transcriptional regulator [Streptomyces fenghuangensis]|uniref:MarR family winged helix-turn-helix transcriptional regulator n=1 Tax=Streptomyces chitinivorans TaxID=1257027 RepID=A0ABW7HVA3_9ACTN|nr:MULTISPECIES: MarR family transcriptional regulator [Streptomyces]MCG3041566.1 MarR family transcriptional regulator [Streptomyces sp. ICN903]MDH2408238.1 MarR family transcriptional regulator [Streptomyces chitinivorans]
MGTTRWLDDDEQRTWRAFLAATQRVREELDRQLQRDAGMPLAYYQILAMLSEAPDRTLTMSRLARTTRSSASRLSHAVARLEAKGWVSRCQHPADHRTTLATLTDEGLAELEAIAPGHVEQVRLSLFDHLTPEQTRHLHEICRAVLEGTSEGPAPAD